MRILLLILDGLVAYWALRVLDTAPRFAGKWDSGGRAAIAYIVFVLCGIVAFIIMPIDLMSDRAVIFGIGAMLCWVFLGVLWMMRKAPGDIKLPDWLMVPWGVADWVLIALLVACAGTAAIS